MEEEKKIETKFTMDDEEYRVNHNKKTKRRRNPNTKI